MGFEFNVFNGSRATAVGELLRVTESPEARRILAPRALPLAEAAHLPHEVIGFLRLQAVAARRGRVAASDLAAFASEPQTASDALLQDTAYLMAADIPTGPGSSGDAVAYAQRVAEDGRLPDHHPLRQLGWLRLADLKAQAGDHAGAQASFDKTGLTEEQCAMLGAKPSMTHSGASSADYPLEAFLMGFEGWVKLEFDVSVDGRAANARPIITYPPLIFGQAATEMTKAFRYEATYRPSGGAACSADQQMIKFAIPVNHK